MLNFVVGAAAGYAVISGGLYFAQERFIFPWRDAVTPQFPLYPGAEIMELPANDVDKIVGMLKKPPGGSDELVIAFSGNAWNAQDCLNFVCNSFPDSNVSVFHYRGYKPSGGFPSQEALFVDAQKIYDHLCEGLKVRRVYLCGFSLGSGVASYLASTRKIDGIIYVTPYDSIAAIAKARYKIFPVDLLLKHPFNSVEYMKGLDVKTAVIKAETDVVVPHSHTQKLVDVLQKLVFTKTIAGTTHGSVYDHEDAHDIMREALEAIKQED